MKKTDILMFSFLMFFIPFTNNFSQSFDVIGYFKLWGHTRIVHYDYSYEEFNKSAYLDSSAIMESFSGKLSVTIENKNISYAPPHAIKYAISIRKVGKRVKRTFFDTLSVENISSETKDSVFEVEGSVYKGGQNYIHGWIFPDTLVKSVVDTLDITPMYPYSKLFRFYNIENDDSLFSHGDTLSLHYRPKPTNYNDSYFSIDYTIHKEKYLIDYEKRYSYHGTGFREKLHYLDVIIISVKSTSDSIPENAFLSQNYPNPFNPSTKIKYSIPTRSNVKIVIYDVLGNTVDTLIDEIKNSGEYEIGFNGSSLSSGVYYYRMEIDNASITKKLLLLK